MKIGSIVMCIDDSNWKPFAYHVFNALPVKGKLYTVREIYPADKSIGIPEDGLLLEGIIGDLVLWKKDDGKIILVEYNFRQSRFREILQTSNTENAEVPEIYETEIV